MHYSAVHRVAAVQVCISRASGPVRTALWLTMTFDWLTMKKRLHPLPSTSALNARRVMPNPTSALAPAAVRVPSRKASESFTRNRCSVARRVISEAASDCSVARRGDERARRGHEGEAASAC